MARLLVFPLVVAAGLLFIYIIVRINRTYRSPRPVDELDKAMYEEYKQLKRQANVAKLSHQADYAKMLDRQANELLKKVRE